MSLVPLRPRFELRVALPREEVFRRLEALVEQQDNGCIGNVHSDHADLGIPEGDQHFWSPFLKIVVRADCPADSEAEPREKSNYVRLDGRFGPNSNVWTMFLAIYAFCGFSAFGAVIIGFSQWSIGHSPSGFIAAAVAVIAGVAAYGVALVGQGLAADQMQRLRDLALEAFDDSVMDPSS